MSFSKSEIIDGLEHKQFELHYQPIISLKQLKVSGVEALIRWRHPDRGVLTPDHFLETLKEYNLLQQAGQWVISECLQDWQNWIDNDLVDKSLFLSINVSMEELETKGFVDQLTKTVQEQDRIPETLYLELKEQTALTLTDTNPGLLRRIESISSVNLCVDNVGDDEVSFKKLRRLPVNTIKFDRTFLNSTDSEVDQGDFAEYFIQYALDKDYIVIAEGIENHDQFEQYYEYGCHFGQGFYFSKPITDDPTGILDNAELKSIVSEFGGPGLINGEKFNDIKVLELQVMIGATKSPIRDMLEQSLVKNELSFTSESTLTNLENQIRNYQWDVLVIDDKIHDKEKVVELIDDFLSNNQERYVILLESETRSMDEKELESYKNLHVKQKPISENDFIALLSSLSFQFEEKKNETAEESNILTRYLGNSNVRFYTAVFVISTLLGLSLGFTLSSVSTKMSSISQSVDSKIERLLDSIEKIEEHERKQTPNR